MGDVVKLLKQFLVRDLMFITGGSMVILAGMHSFSLNPAAPVPTAIYLVGLGFAYVVGYAVQELFAVLGIVRTAAPYVPGLLIQEMFRRCAHRAYPRQLVAAEVAPKSPSIGDLAGMDEWARGLRERYVAHMQVSTTVGPCAIVSAGLLLRCAIQDRHEGDLFLLLAMAVLGLVLIPFGWLKLAQWTEFDHELALGLADKNVSKLTTGS